MCAFDPHRLAKMDCRLCIAEFNALVSSLLNSEDLRLKEDYIMPSGMQIMTSNLFSLNKFYKSVEGILGL